MTDTRDQWEAHARFFHRSVVLDILAPLIGLAIFVYQVVIQSDLWAGYVAAAGLVGVPGVTRLAEKLTK